MSEEVTVFGTAQGAILYVDARRTAQLGSTRTDLHANYRLLTHSDLLVQARGQVEVRGHIVGPNMPHSVVPCIQVTAWRSAEPLSRNIAPQPNIAVINCAVSPKAAEEAHRVLRVLRNASGDPEVLPFVRTGIADAGTVLGVTITEPQRQ